MKNLFKVGDIVTCNSLNTFGSSPFNLSNFIVGNEYKVLEVTDEHYKLSARDTYKNTDHTWLSNHKSGEAEFIIGFSLKKQKFPEKWAIKLLPEVKKWIRDEFNTDSYDDDCETHYFHFPNFNNNNGFLDYYHLNDRVNNKYTEITLQEFLDNVVNKQKPNTIKEKKVYTTRKDLIFILSQDACSMFNDVIKKYLKEYYTASEDFIFEITQVDLQRIEKECSIAQKAILKSIGINYIEPKPLWSRGNITILNISSLGISSFEELHIYNTMLLMRNWAKFHNELDEFIPRWENKDQNKYGIISSYGSIIPACYFYNNFFMFQIAVSSAKRAKQMLEEFKEDLKKCKF